MDVVVFEDTQVRNLEPITLARPAFLVGCGSYCLLDWLKQLGGTVVPVVHDYLRALVLLDDGELSPTIRTEGSRLVLLVNARLVPSHDNFRILQQLQRDAIPVQVRAGEVLVAACVPADRLPVEEELTAEAFQSWLTTVDLSTLPSSAADMAVLDYPHDVVRYNEKILNANLAYRLETGEFDEPMPGVFTAANVQLDNSLAADTSQGPIVLDRGVSIGPHVYFCGPAYIGPGTRVIEHAAVKHAVSIGHTAKIGGEVEASVIEAYSNKQHHGFLGHSYLGSWINLGAGTCNSDLKNTYGLVNVECHGRRVATGMQFVGCVMGDYSKTAINTGIFTGKMIGVCSMLYGFVTTNVPSFVNYARLFGQITELPPEVMIATQRRMFARRNVEQRPCDIQLIRDMFINTNAQRSSVVSAEAIAL